MLPLLAKSVWACPLDGPAHRDAGRLTSRAAMLLAVVGRTSRDHPRTTVAVLLLLLLASAGGGYTYAVHLTDSAQIALREGRLDEAKNDLALCLLVRPLNSRVHLLAARAARLGGDLPGAEAQLQRCLKLEHGATQDIQLEFLLMRVQRGEVDQVEPQLMAYVNSKHTDTPLILETLARAYMHNLRFRPALETLDRWIAEAPRGPGVAKAYFYRGWVVEKLLDHEGALHDYQQAVELAPDLVDVRLRLADMYMDKTMPLDALPHLELLMREHPDRADVQAALGRCLFMVGQSEKARPLLEAAVKRLPNDTPLLIHLGKLELQEYRPAEAETWLRLALKVDPSDLEAQNNLIESLRVQGRQKEAATALDKFTRDRTLHKQADDLLKSEVAHPTSGPAVPYQIGTIFLHLGQDRLGVDWLIRALEPRPRAPPDAPGFGRLLCEEGRPQPGGAARPTGRRPSPRQPVTGTAAMEAA